MVKVYLELRYVLFHHINSFRLFNHLVVYPRTRTNVASIASAAARIFRRLQNIYIYQYTKMFLINFLQCQRGNDKPAARMARGAAGLGRSFLLIR